MARMLHVERGSKKKPLSPLDLLLVLRVVHLKQAELLAVVCHCFCKEESYSEEMEPSILFQEWGWILRVYIQFVESIYIWCFFVGGPNMATESLGKTTKELRQGQLHVLTQLEVPPGQQGPRASRLDFLDFGGISGIIRNVHWEISMKFPLLVASLWPQRINEGIAIFLCYAGEISFSPWCSTLVTMEWIANENPHGLGFLVDIHFSIGYRCPNVKMKSMGVSKKSPIINVLGMNSDTGIGKIHSKSNGVVKYQSPSLSLSLSQKNI